MMNKSWRRWMLMVTSVFACVVWAAHAQQLPGRRGGQGQPVRGGQSRGRRPGEGQRRQFERSQESVGSASNEVITRQIGLIKNTADAADGYTLFAPKHYLITYLINNEGQMVNTWTSQYEPGQSVYLLETGNLLHCCFTKSGSVGGGEGGRLEEYDWDGNLVWEYWCADQNKLMHHDIEPMPNGNTLICDGTSGVFFEVKPDGEIVWEYVCPVDGEAPLEQGDPIPIDDRGHAMNAVFKTHRYPVDHPAFEGKDLTPKGPITGSKPQNVPENLSRQRSGRGGGGQRGGDQRRPR